MPAVPALTATTDAQRAALAEADYVSNTAGSSSPEWTTALGVLAAHFDEAKPLFADALERSTTGATGAPAEHRWIVTRALRRRGYLREAILVARRGHSTIEIAADCARALGDHGTSLTIRLEAAQAARGDKEAARLWLGVAADATALGNAAAATEAKALGEKHLARVRTSANDLASQRDLRVLLAQLAGGNDGLVQIVAILDEIGDDKGVRSTTTGRSATAWAVDKLVELGDLPRATALQKQLWEALHYMNTGVPSYEAAEDLIALQIRIGEGDQVRALWEPQYAGMVRDFEEEGGDAHWHCRFIKRVIDRQPV